MNDRFREDVIAVGRCVVRAVTPVRASFSTLHVGVSHERVPVEGYFIEQLAGLQEVGTIVDCLKDESF